MRSTPLLSRIIRTAAGIIGVGVATSAAGAQTLVQANVRDAHFRPLFGAVVKATLADGRVMEGTTNRDGLLTLNLPDGAVRFGANKAGFHSAAFSGSVPQLHPVVLTLVSRSGGRGESGGEVVLGSEWNEQTLTVESSIARGASRSDQHFARFTVPPNGEALHFWTSADEFLIYSIENGVTRTYHQRIASVEKNPLTGRPRTQVTETPGPLTELTLGPGTYIFSIPGNAGTMRKLSMVIRTP